MRGAFSNSQRQAIYQREDQSCAWCGKWAQGGSIQHRKARGAGGTRRSVTLADGVLLCGSGVSGCHGMMEANPRTATHFGYRVPQALSVADTPIYIKGPGWVFLLPEGGYKPATAPPEDAAA